MEFFNPQKFLHLVIICNCLGIGSSFSFTPSPQTRPRPSNFRLCASTASSSSPSVSSLSASNGTLPNNGKHQQQKQKNKIDDNDDLSSPLSLGFDQLSSVMGGSGRAKLIWKLLRQGIDPLDDQYYNAEEEQIIEELGKKAIRKYEMNFKGTIESQISRVSNVQVAADGTTKLLIKLHQDGLEVETVLIPWDDRQSSTLCVSSQVGCRQGCTFCMTGRMGKLRSLTADEILSQVFHAVRFTSASASSSSIACYPIDNVVFMGMGEPADNVEAVTRVARILVDSNQFQLAPRRVTISTVGLSPQSFLQLGQAPAVLAWSVHASQDDLRRQLVPTTKYSMVELREGLIQALQKRSRRLQSIMLEVTLLDAINDSVEDAHHLADFCLPIIEQVPNTKLVINVIPWNDISASSGPAALYNKPSPERVLRYQKTLVEERGMRCLIRTTRGDDESAACGQLATKKTNTADQTTQIIQ
mmetsp:Transcript_2151/g.2980  ORF Transcript_2151/g.2980 Transcript_2151/m.2980 type:complete len:471 (+) Transcript_2151:129-1541(+)|eukprot:CAMPEP_0198153964 /NCGR_PEP_ID=MMETSP1443-20131203/66550_1 /TAXON_ID=186043 /ORGANISM="Entomoneis sp., Strain CCMP2396" /LENGTH=470 /DNA_ID=CAMNT_0043820501 /DNA_START=139 /DNA_END=1551 /DNA_ORIENTATION=-